MKCMAIFQEKKRNCVSAVSKIFSFFCRLFYPLQRVNTHDFPLCPLRSQQTLKKQQKTMQNFNLQGLPLLSLISLLPVPFYSPENPYLLSDLDS